MTPVKAQYRAVFVSDLHLGAVGSQPERANEFLKSVEAEYLYLVGDIIDGWVGRERKWGQEHTDCVQTILSHAREGCHVRYTPGNHDDIVRRMNGSVLGNLTIDHSFTHTSLTGEDYLVVHGDLFDRSVSKYRPLARLGAYLSEFFSIADKTVSRMRAKKGKPALGYAAKMKTAVKRYIAMKSSYELEAIEFGREGGFDGIICGHVHRPVVEVFPDGFVYYNTGDWVQHCTALVEHLDGRFELLHLDFKAAEAPSSSAAVEPIGSIRGN